MTKVQTRDSPAAAARQLAAGAVRRPVAFYDCGHGTGPRGHDQQTKMALARALAELLEVDYLGELDDARLARERIFVVPSDTLTSVEHARRLGITRAEHLFGGVVPHPVVATKVITHPLVHADAEAPEGWSAEFADAVRDVVLPGLSVFSADDARRAGERLLRDGAVRLKAAGGVGGAGQHVARDLTELRAHVDSIDAGLLRRDGLVLECNLADVTTHSVGQVRVGPWVASYCGTQQLVRNHHGHEVYGGSCLTVVRGGYTELRGLTLAPAQRLAVDQALAYHERALTCFAGLMASRSNYDVAQGADAAGQARSGVLEQSWRIGGASAAEILALRAFRADPGLRVVRASTHEVYGDGAVIPADAQVHFDGLDDARIGRLRKYARVEHDGRA
jgi:hypothetical protein